jgi:quercetin dioxygenase-like cupin family protein
MPAEPRLLGSGSGTVRGAEARNGHRAVPSVQVPAHWHPTDESVTVLRGMFLAGMGESYDEAKLETMAAGSFATIPKQMRHFAKAKGEAFVQVHGIGPFKVNWVNPADVVPPPQK